MKEEHILEIFVKEEELEIFPEESNEEQSEQQQVQVPVTIQAIKLEITQNRKSGLGKFFPCPSESHKKDQHSRQEEKRREEKISKEEQRRKNINRKRLIRRRAARLKKNLQHRNSNQLQLGHRRGNINCNYKQQCTTLQETERRQREDNKKTDSQHCKTSWQAETTQ